MTARKRTRIWLPLVALSPCLAFAQEDDFIDATRPSVSESATIQRAGVLQIEPGIDSDFRAPDYRSQQSMPIAFRFAASDRLRLDLDVDALVSQLDLQGDRTTGMGDTALGFKAIAIDKPKERVALAFSYSIKLPTASEDKGLGSGRVDHNLRLILNRTFDKTDAVINASYLNIGRDDSDKRADGAQVIFTATRELPKNFGLIAELYGQSVDEAQPRGVYALGALTYKINRRLRVDAGVRRGWSSDAPDFGVFAGFTIGIADFYR